MKKVTLKSSVKLNVGNGTLKYGKLKYKYIALSAADKATDTCNVIEIARKRVAYVYRLWCQITAYKHRLARERKRNSYIVFQWDNTNDHDLEV